MKITPKITILLIFAQTSIYSQSYVSMNANGLNNGTSWENAYSDLVTALTESTEKEIWVAEGIYYPDLDPLKSFRWSRTSSVSILGGFKGDESVKSQRNPGENYTILSGDIGVKNDSSDNSVHVFLLRNLPSTSIEIDGLVITQGNWENDSKGAGIYIENCGPVSIKNCVIYNNQSLYGGGIYVRACDPLIEKNIFYSNRAYQGGAILLDYDVYAQIDNNIFINNKATDYPGRGYSANDGGGILINAYVTAEIRNNKFIGNLADNDGGAINADGNYFATISGNYIENNFAKEGGGIFLSNIGARIINNVMVRNEAEYSGGGLCITDNFDLDEIYFSNNTIAFNKSLKGGGIMLEKRTTIKNSIFYYNSAFEGGQVAIDSYFGIPTFEHNVIEEGVNGMNLYKRSDNDTIIAYDLFLETPLFLDTLENNLQLQESSVAINSGSPDTLGLYLSTLDILNNSRIFDDTLDIGAIEFNGVNGEPEYLVDRDSMDAIINRIKSLTKIEEKEEQEEKHVLSVDNQNLLQIYPNPTQKHIIVNNQNDYIRKLWLYDLSGVLLFDLNIDNQGKAYFNNLTSGTYLLIADDGRSARIVIR